VRGCVVGSGEKDTVRDDMVKNQLVLVASFAQQGSNPKTCRWLFSPACILTAC
jgi:hypothetical protein